MQICTKFEGQMRFNAVWPLDMQKNQNILRLFLTSYKDKCYNLILGNLGFGGFGLDDINYKNSDLFIELTRWRFIVTRKSGFKIK